MNKILVIFALVTLSLGANQMVGQVKRNTFNDASGLSDFSEPDAQRNTSTIMPQIKGAALESVIDPNSYYVGPSDQFSVNIWAPVPLNFLLTVTPEGTLIVPSVGEIRIADMTLAAAKSAVLREIARKYTNGKPTVTLMIPRSVVVTVTGHVLNPGSFVLPGYNRADRAVEEAMKLDRTQYHWESDLLTRTSSHRNIRIIHKDGSVSPVDIPKFLATREDRWNPYLREGDAIVVPKFDQTNYVVGVYGEVNVPGQYEYVQGDSLKDLIRIAYGLTPQAKADSVELSRMNSTGAILVSEYFDARALLDGKIPDKAVLPGDRIVVRTIPDLRGDYRVTIEGEVVYPGRYPISRNTTHLSDVIAQAGGFRPTASLRNAELVRNVLERKDLTLERLRSIHGGVPPEDTMYYDLENALRMQREIVNVDFEQLFSKNDTTADVILQDYDVIYVPSTLRTVYIFGQVVSPGHIPWVAHEGLDYYLRKAGDITDRARRGDIKIIKAKTRQWLSPSETTIEEGDYIWVPKEIERTFAYYMNVIGQTASVIGVAATVALLVVQLKK